MSNANNMLGPGFIRAASNANNVLGQGTAFDRSAGAPNRATEQTAQPIPKDIRALVDKLFMHAQWHGETLMVMHYEPDESPERESLTAEKRCLAEQKTHREAICARNELLRALAAWKWAP